MDDDVPPAPKSYYGRSSVDTSRPFSSVKEAVAIFGERFLLRDIYHSAPIIMKTTTTTTDSPSSWKSASPSPSPSSMPDVVSTNDNEGGVVLVESVKRLEAELEETKAELKQLKERGSETEIALASLNAELHLNMAKMAQAEAAAAKKAADERDVGGSDQLMMVKMASSPTLAQILNLGSEMSSNGGYYLNKTKMTSKTKKKKKPIVPLVGDFLYSWKKKGSNNSALNDNPLYGSPNVF